MNRLQVFIVILVNLMGFGCGAVQKEMTIIIDAGQRECFYERAKVGQAIDVDYQVIDGGHGDLDISFVLHDPNGIQLIDEYKKSDNTHRLETKTDGHHGFCFDNSFSSFNRKTVFFEIIIEAEGEVPEKDEWGRELLDGLTPEEFVDMKTQDIVDIISKVHHNLNAVKHAQDLRRSGEARDRNIAEENNLKVQSWSMFQIAMMLAVGAVQVYMVRSLFETNSKVSSVWRKIPFAN